MRYLALIAAFAASPALAQIDVSYDDSILSACLDETAQSQPQPLLDYEPLRACIGKASETCIEGPDGSSNAGISACISHETADWDALLNKHYERAMTRAKAADADLAELGSAASPAAPVLQQAQRNWMSFRDASCEYESVRYQGGTAGGPASAACMMELTATQALRLMQIAGPEE